MTSMHIDTTELDEVHEALTSVLTGADREILARRIQSEMERSVAMAFGTKRDPESGKPWKRRAEDVPWPLLERTGALHHGLIETVKRGKVNLWGKFQAPDDAALAIRTYVHYFGRKKNSRKRGGTRGGGPMPARRMVGLSKKQIHGINALAKKLVKKALKGKKG